ncbi:hypothetical protein C8046_05825 [Serinibacter arcticus]|uniref:Thiamin/hydroxymethyl pyrimidine-binding YkoF putative domain-containing protein n=2 Tax=Serinibacter arcticus TaxID=1655435 RepID=A0A2U1ZZJ5_9MICO|nr:hypothetical protein C8046_05825 [Serinibacter arcticus]
MLLTSPTPTTPVAGPSAGDLTRDPLTFGVGARVTASVMADDYVDVLTRALAEVSTDGLVLSTGDVSTYVGGSETDLLRYLTDLGAALAATGHHVTLTVHLSRGCPGEVVCERPGGAGPRGASVPPTRTTGRLAAAEWALYPLADAAPAVGPDGAAPPEPDHMRDIYAAIDHARELGTFRGSEHFVTRLEGDLGDVLATAVAGWVLVGRSVQHVTSHLQVSLNSPNHAAPAGATDGAIDGEVVR